jgi:hypothetical protein
MEKRNLQQACVDWISETAKKREREETNGTRFGFHPALSSL